MVGVEAVMPTRSVGSSRKRCSRSTSTMAMSKSFGVTAASEASASVGTSNSHGRVISFRR